MSSHHRNDRPERAARASAQTAAQNAASLEEANWYSSSFDLAHGLVVCELGEALLDAFEQTKAGGNMASADRIPH